MELKKFTSQGIYKHPSGNFAFAVNLEEDLWDPRSILGECLLDGARVQVLDVVTRGLAPWLRGTQIALVVDKKWVK